MDTPKEEKKLSRRSFWLDSLAVPIAVSLISSVAGSWVVLNYERSTREKESLSISGNLPDEAWARTEIAYASPSDDNRPIYSVVMNDGDLTLTDVTILYQLWSSEALPEPYYTFTLSASTNLLTQSIKTESGKSLSPSNYQYMLTVDRLNPGEWIFWGIDGDKDFGLHVEVSTESITEVYDVLPIIS